MNATNRRRAQEFRKFLNTIEVHLVIYNAGTHMTKRVRDGSPNVPAGISTSPRPRRPWINQVERFFGSLTNRQVRRGTYRSTAELEAAIEAYIDNHNAKPKPFRWTKSATISSPSSIVFAAGHSTPKPLCGALRNQDTS
jgi:hypothetical protein